MIELTYRNSRGESIKFGMQTKFFITNLEGFSDVDNEINTSKAYGQDGETITDATLSKRHLVIQGEFLPKPTQTTRNRLLQVFNPKLDGMLTYKNGNTKRIIYCRPEKSPTISIIRNVTVPFIINLVASDPYWLSEDVKATEMVSWIGGLTFPLQLPTEFALAGEKTINIINQGNVATPITLEISGVATNPKIINTLTGEFIKVNRTLSNGDTMKITTGFGNKRVEQNGVNVFNYIDLDSTFFSLNAGDNVIRLETDEVSDQANIKISYRNRYIGV